MRLSSHQNKPKILLIADVPNWIFARHCQAIKNLLSDEFNFTIKFFQESYNEDDYELIYPLEFNLVDPKKIKDPSKYVTGIRSHISWQGLDFANFAKNLTEHFQMVHTVSNKLYDTLCPFLPQLVHLAHGVDTDFFTPSTNMQASPKGALKLGFAGNRNTEVKGFKDFVEPLAKIRGVELVSCGYDSNNLNKKAMREFYRGIDAYICASLSEGHNNSLMEASAMQRAIITTDTGTVSEYLTNEKNALVVERELPCFIQAVIRLRDDPKLRAGLGQRARPAVVKSFDWSRIVEGYRSFFLRALSNKNSWKPEISKLLKEFSKD